MMSSFTDSLKPVSQPQYTYRRGSLNLNSFSLEEDCGLSSSLPLNISKDDLDSLDTPKKSKQKALQHRSGTFSSGSHSPTQLSVFGLGGFRPRSISLYSPKKNFLGLPKTRSPSVKKSPKHGSDTGRDSNTSAIDAALATIRKQLEQLSEEDQIMEERVNRLTSEISKLVVLRERNPRRNYGTGSLLFQQLPKPYKGYKRTLSDESCRHQLGVEISDSHYGNIVLSDLKETWEEQTFEKSCEEEIKCVPFDLACMEFDDHHKQKGNSLGSTESIDSSGSPLSGVCVVIVTDASGDTLEPAMAASQTSGSSQAEDDVFLS
ncbi:uncharacterized protein LOC135351007 [Halichondria panicea]|uniref:uncharacterized protein LOC135351007 n=1 Tax=Halichondria panicea TaxID=6063 RepID=UPI00312BA6F8